MAVSMKQAVPRPATEASARPAGASLACRHCQKPNAANRRFCGGCGQGLWEPCPRCGAECAADEAFCGACGTDVAGELNRLSRQLGDRMNQARRLATEFRYDEGLATLREAATLSDSRLAHLTQQVGQEILRIDAEARKRREAAEAALARARKAIDAQDYESAVGELESVPRPLHGKESLALLARARSAQEELAALCGEIRTALAEKRFGGLPRLVERLLALKPDHEQVLAIAEQLKSRLVQAAKKALAAGEFAVALDQLARIAPAVRAADVEQLTETAQELAALLDGVRGAALADRPTLALAQRLVKLAPHNVEAAKLRDELSAKVKSRPTDPRWGAPNFAPLPSRKLNGPPIDWLARPGRLAADDEAAAALGEHPGQFFVAIGLALQVLGEAAIALDLMPQERSSLLKLDLTAALSRSQKALAAWGIDWSDNGLKAVKLAKDSPTAEPRIVAALHLPGRTPLAQFTARAGDLKGTKIAAGLPGQQVLGRFFDLPPLPAKKVADAVCYEASHQLPIPLEELSWASHVQDAVEGKTADEAARRILVVAARSAHVRERIAALKAAGIQANCLTSECLALHNALVHELFDANDPAGQPAAVCGLDVGAASTNIVVSSPTCVWFRTFGQGGDAFTSQLVRQLGLTKDQAEALKGEPAEARRYGQFREAIQPPIVQLAGEVQRSLASYGKSFPDHPVQQIYGLGGAFQSHGLLRYLRFGK